MTTAQDNPVQPGHVASMLDYTLDRHTALTLVSRNKIATDGALLRRWDGADLDSGVFASLLALHNEGYIETHESPAGSPRPGRQRPLRLTLRGMQLLSRFNLEHAQHAVDAAPANQSR
jgi:hypothetical protein